MTAALDAHAAAGSMPVVRSGVDSVVQRAGGGSALQTPGVGEPAGAHPRLGRTLLDLRHDLAGELATRARRKCAVSTSRSTSKRGLRAAARPGLAVRDSDAAEQYARAFSHWAGEHLPVTTSPASGSMQGYVTVTLSSGAPADMALSAGASRSRRCRWRVRPLTRALGQPVRTGRDADAAAADAHDPRGQRATGLARRVGSGRGPLLLNPAGDPSHQNLRPRRRIGSRETSPYLRQHRFNRWTGIRGSRGVRGGAPSRRSHLLSIGYSTCYWCHVMERDRSRTATSPPG